MGPYDSGPLWGGLQARGGKVKTERGCVDEGMGSALAGEGMTNGR